MIRPDHPEDILDAEGNLAWVTAHLVAIAPLLGSNWFMTERAPDGALWDHASGRMRVILSGARESDGKRWLHVSVSRRERIPDHDDLSLVKRLFIGPDCYAVHVFPPAAVHVNLHGRVLHLFSCADGHPLPEFSGVVRGVRTL